MKNFALLVLRLTIGTIMAGHGVQKLFGWFSGPGLKGTHGMMESLGMKPGNVWGTMAAVGETSGGVLTGLGLLNPIGPLNIASSMTVATRRVHWKTPIWVSSGGAELTLTNIAISLTLAIFGPGRFSLDNALGIRLPRAVVAAAWLTTLGITAAAIQRPELAQTVMDKAKSAAGGPMTPMIDDPTTVVETVPTAGAEEKASAER